MPTIQPMTIPPRMPRPRSVPIVPILCCQPAGCAAAAPNCPSWLR